MSMKRKLFIKTWKLGKLNQEKLLKTKSVDLDFKKKIGDIYKRGKDSALRLLYLKYVKTKKYRWCVIHYVFMPEKFGMPISEPI